MSKKITLALIVSITLIVATFLYTKYLNQQEEGQRIAKYCVAVVVESNDKISLNKCKELVKAAGGIEQFQEILKANR